MIDNYTFIFKRLIIFLELLILKSLYLSEFSKKFKVLLRETFFLSKKMKIWLIIQYFIVILLQDITYLFYNKNINSNKSKQLYS